ncbi:MAG: dUTP diphosphatase [Clostridia bacterium]|nr:dUTP diphosphatase [Clostridia bacterium]
MIPTVRVQLLRDGAVLPSYGSAFAAGADLRACTDAPFTEIRSGETKLIPTGVAMEIPAGYVGLVCARSGVACKRGLAPANKVGVIDSDYRGEILVALHNHSGETQRIERGERIAQLVITPYLAVQFTEADTLEDTVRGAGGFGSTGSK